jgi:AcrR family transcriptional regulator
MSPRKPAVLRGGGENLREYLIATAARLIGERGSAGLAVRDIAREAQVADGALYNYFEDKEDLLAQALLVHVGSVMSGAPRMPPPGTGTVAQNLELFVNGGLAVLERVAPAFAGLQSQPRVLIRFHAMVGGDAAFGVAGPDAAADGAAEGGAASPGPRGLPDILRDYLSAEQRLGRIDASTDIDAASMLVVGAIHGQILPRILLSPPGSPMTTPPGFAAALAKTVLNGIAPGAARS